MNKKLLIGIIAGVVAVGAVIIGVLIGTSQNNAQNCKHEDPAKIVVVKAVAPTCQKTGLTEGKKCTNCGTMVLPQSIVQTIECIESDWIVDIAATHTEDGKHHTECTMCGKLLREEVVLSGNKQLKYTLLDNGTYEVSGIGNCKDKNIVIPSEYNGLPVTSIGGSAFVDCSSLTSIEIPNSVTSIGDFAFLGCDSLTSITVDEKNEYYKSIDGNLYTKDGKTLIQYAIGKQATSFTIPNSVTSIGDYAFYNCSSLTSIEIPDSVTSIRNSAFKNCISLTSVTIPNSVTSIGNSTFSSCDSLTSITIGNSVTSIGDWAFYDCYSLTSIEIPDSVTSIGDFAFYNCLSLTSIEIPDSVTSISKYAFFQCASLTSVTIPDSVTSIGERAFYRCVSLTSITIPDSVTSIGNYAFVDCSSLTSIVIPDSVTSIGYYVFSGCTSLTIYCEAGSKPSGWDAEWNYSNRPVVWGYTGE